jgi:FdhE protein
MNMDAPPAERWPDPPRVLLPKPSSIFFERSRRLASLAKGHSMGPWLSFLGRLTSVQHDLLQKYRPLPRPEKGAVSSPGEHTLPPLSASSWQRDSLWRQGAAELARKLEPYAPPLGKKTLVSIQAMEAETLEELADRVLACELDGADAAYLPFIAAALQVYWTALAAGLDQAKIALSHTAGTCPACGFLPVAGIIRTDGEVARPQ